MTRRMINELNNTTYKKIFSILHMVALNNMHTERIASTSIPMSIRRLKVAIIAFM